MAGPATFGRRDHWASVQLELHVSAKLNLSHSTEAGVLETLCSSGATLRLSRPQRIGSNGYLGFAEHSLYCSIAWTEGDRCGVLFDRVLSSLHMEQLAWISRNHDTYDRSLMTREARTWR